MPSYRPTNLEIRMSALGILGANIFVLKIYQSDLDLNCSNDSNCEYWKNNFLARFLYGIIVHMCGAGTGANDESAWIDVILRKNEFQVNSCAFICQKTDIRVEMDDNNHKMES